MTYDVEIRLSQQEWESVEFALRDYLQGNGLKEGDWLDASFWLDPLRRAHEEIRFALDLEEDG